MSVIERETAKQVTDADVLERAAYLLEEFGWTQGETARGSDGRPVCFDGPAAASFCLIGAIGRAEVDLNYACREIRENMGVLIAWNDDTMRTKEQVIERLRSMAKDYT